ncbi:ABC transporter permease [Candidatus Parcubacteria bacterium]|nr:ABC transporter permease [Candidatus Parcubacteria bacterium]
MTTLTDLVTMIERNMLRYIRIPQLLIFSSIQPVMFLLLFTFVFGGAIAGGGNYIDFLLPGILVQSVLFGSTATGIGLVEDLSKGLIDRFRSLPMARSAVLAGRTLTDMMRNIFVILLMVAVGYIIGYRFHGSFADALTALAILLYFGFAFSWISATIGMLVRTPETAQVAGFIWIFPLVFTSSIFVPIQTMPHWLQAIARINPITVISDTLRMLSQGGASTSDLVAHLLVAFGWIALILVVFVPWAVSLYRKVV